LTEPAVWDFFREALAVAQVRATAADGNLVGPPLMAPTEGRAMLALRHIRSVLQGTRRGELAVPES